MNFPHPVLEIEPLDMKPEKLSATDAMTIARLPVMILYRFLIHHSINSVH